MKYFLRKLEKINKDSITLKYFLLWNEFEFKNQKSARVVFIKGENLEEYILKKSFPLNTYNNILKELLPKNETKEENILPILKGIHNDKFKIKTILQSLLDHYPRSKERSISDFIYYLVNPHNENKLSSLKKLIQALKNEKENENENLFESDNEANMREIKQERNQEINNLMRDLKNINTENKLKNYIVKRLKNKHGLNLSTRRNTVN